MNALVCPACGGSLGRPREGEVSTLCPYCGIVVQLARPSPANPTPTVPVRRPTWILVPVTVLVVLTAIAIIFGRSREPKQGSNKVLAFVRAFGSEGAGIGAFTDVRGFAAGNGLIYTLERKGRVQAFDLEGKPAGSWIMSGEYNQYGFVAGSDGSLYRPRDRTLYRFEGKTGKPLGEFDARAQGLASWQFLAPGPSGTLFAADDRTAIQLNPATGQALMRSPYRRPFRSTGGLTHFAANPLGEVYFADMAEHDVVRVAPDGELKGRFVTTKLEGLTPLTMGIALLPRSARLGIATAIGLELYDPDGRFLDLLRHTALTHLAAPDERHLAGWVNYSHEIRVFEVR